MKNVLRILIFLAVTAPQLSHACSVCMGDPNSNVAKGANGMVFFMLGVLGCIFGLLGTFAYQIYRHSKLPTPPHAELGDADAQPTTGLS